MNKQIIVFADSYGIVQSSSRHEKKPNPLYKSVYDYTEDGWRVTHVQGTGRTGSMHGDGAFCFIMEKFIPKPE